MGVPTKTGNLKWSTSTIYQMLNNEKYIGEVIQGKYYTVDVLTHRKKRNNGEEDIYHIKSHHQPLVTIEDWEKVQERIKNNNGIKCKKYNNDSLGIFTNKIKCGFCGDYYIKRKVRKEKNSWECNSVVKVARIYCPNSKAINTSIIENGFMEGFKALADNKDIISDNIKKYINEMNISPIQNEINKINKKKNEYESKLSNLIDIRLAEQIDEETFERKRIEIQNKVLELSDNIDKLKEDDKSNIYKDINTERLTDIIFNLTKDNLGSFNSKLFSKLIDYVVIGGIDEGKKYDPYLIRYILKTNFRDKRKYELSKDEIVLNNDLNKKDSIYINILDYYYSTKFSTFEKDDLGKLNKKFYNKVRCRFEIEK